MVTEAERHRQSTRYVDLPFVVIALTCGVLLLYLGRSLTFWEDEWRSITFDGGPLDYLRPVNQHWSTLPLLLFRATFHVVELRSYLPYLAEVVALHLVAVTGAYALIRKRVGPLVATLFAVPLLFLGSGAENLFWGFQTGFVGSVVFGVWALFFVERPTRRAAAIASLLLVGALASSGMGIFFLVVVAGRTIFDSSLRTRALAVVPPFMLYLVWFALVGRDTVGEDRLYVEPAVARFAVRGIVYSTERIVGLDHLPDGHLWAIALFLGLSLVTGLRIVRGHQQALAAACLLGVAAMYTVIGFVRLHADPGYDHATSSRYVYVAAFLLMLAVVDLLPPRSAWPAEGRPAVVVLVGLLLAVGCVTAANLDDLVDKRAEFQHSADVTRAFVELAVTRGNEPWIDRQAPRGWYPPIAELVHTVELHGSPTRDEWFPGVVHPPGTAAKEAALLSVIGDGYRVEEPRSRGDYVSFEVTAPSSAGITRAGQCVIASSMVAPAAFRLTMPGGARIRVRSPTSLKAAFYLGHTEGPSRPLDVDLEPGSPMDVVIPDVGDPRPWLVGVTLPSALGVARFCVVR
jgi:hypothetical protein